MKSFQRLHSEKGALAGYDIRYIYINTPTVEVLEQRLRARKTNSEQEITRRVQVGRRETEWANAQGVFHSTIINDNYGTSYESFKKAMR